MQDERKRILELVEKGVISAQEALLLLEKLEASTQQEERIQKSEIELDEEKATEESKQTTANSKQEEFVNDLKREFTTFSSKLMDFVNNTVTKVKDMDVPSFGGEDKKFTVVTPLTEEQLQNISVNISNGSFTVKEATNGVTEVVATVKPILTLRSSSDPEEEFRSNFTCKNDHGTLRIISNSKLMHADIVVTLPKQQYDTLNVELVNGNFAAKAIDTHKIDVKTLNGSLTMADLNFQKAKLASTNGAVDVSQVAGVEVEAETLNGRVLIDGAIRDIEAKSGNGNIVIKTRALDAERLKVSTTAGTIDLYVPDHLGLKGEISSNFGQMHVELSDVEVYKHEEQFLQKSVGFTKNVADASLLIIDAEAKTGAVSVNYNL